MVVTPDQQGPEATWRLAGAGDLRLHPQPQHQAWELQAILPFPW